MMNEQTTGYLKAMSEVWQLKEKANAETANLKGRERFTYIQNDIKAARISLSGKYVSL